MKYVFTLFLLVGCAFIVQAQLKAFDESNTRMTLLKGDTVVIAADTAILLSTDVISQINQLTDKYEVLLSRYNGNITVNRRLLAQLTSTKGNLEKLMANHQKGRINVESLSSEIDHLTDLSANLHQNNEDLEHNTVEFDKIIESLKEQNETLTQEIKDLRRDRFRLAIVAGSIGAVIVGSIIFLAMQ